jgi:hypothetical protein
VGRFGAKEKYLNKDVAVCAFFSFSRPLVVLCAFFWVPLFLVVKNECICKCFLECLEICCAIFARRIFALNIQFLIADVERSSVSSIVFLNIYSVASGRASLWSYSRSTCGRRRRRACLHLVVVSVP